MNQLDATMIYWSIRSAQHVSGAAAAYRIKKSDGIRTWKQQQSLRIATSLLFAQVPEIVTSELVQWQPKFNFQLYIFSNTSLKYKYETSQIINNDRQIHVRPTKTPISSTNQRTGIAFTPLNGVIPNTLM